MQAQAYRMLGDLSFFYRICPGWILYVGMVLAVQVCFVPTDFNSDFSSFLWNASSWPILFPERSKAVITVY